MTQNQTAVSLKEVDPKNVFFHLGLEKTGSTFLQLSIFKHLIGIKYHRKSRFKRYTQILAADPKSKHLFSFETDLELENTVDRVVEHMPEANVFLILRRHDSWLSSKYNYHIRKHGYKSLREFFDLENDQGERKKDGLYLKPKIDYIESKIKGRVLFLNYNELKANPEAYVKRMTDFMGTELKPGTNIYKPLKPAFTLKQNRILLKFNQRYHYEHLGSKSRFLNRLWYKYREFLLHLVAFFANLVPQSIVSIEPLIDKAYLAEVREYYAEDWNYALSKVDFKG